MQRPSGAAWVALDRDVSHSLVNTRNGGASAPTSPTMSPRAGVSGAPRGAEASSGEEESMIYPPQSPSIPVPLLGTPPPLASPVLPAVVRPQTTRRVLRGAEGSGSGRHSRVASVGGGGTYSSRPTSTVAPTSPGFPTSSSAASFSAFGTSGAAATAGNTTSTAGPSAPTWRKILYEKQPYEDNYVDAAFMRQLRTNRNLRALEYRDVMRATLAVLQQVNLVVLFVMAYVACLCDQIQPLHLVSSTLGLLGTSMVLYLCLTYKRPMRWSLVLRPIKQAVLVSGVLLLLSPIFHTLTRSYSDDTIWALSITLGFVHIVAADYEYLNATSPHYTHNLSMNAALVGVVLLASRVTDAVAASSVIAIGILLFTASPILRYHVKVASDDAHELSSLIFSGIAIGCLVRLNVVLALLFCFVVLLLTAALPVFFVRAQSGKYKTQIQGPWDEATPRNCSAAAEWANAGLLS